MTAARKTGGRYTAPRSAAVAPIDDFDSDEYRGEPIYTFKLGRREWHCHGDLPWNFLERFFGEAPPEAPADGEADTEGEAQGETIDQARDGLIQVEDFFRNVLVPAEVDPFLEMIKAPGGPLHVRNANALVDRIVAKITGRDPEQPASSARGQRRTRPSSGASSSSRGTGRKRSAS